MLLAPLVGAQAQTSPPAAATVPAGQRPWKGDWDAIVKRGVIRVLVVPSRTQYFVDKGTQRGITYDAFKGFEDETNKNLKTKAISSRSRSSRVADELIPALIAGRGDVAAAIDDHRGAEKRWTSPRRC
jgi:membrane-bound lytic murein transglycosylase MltF